MEDKEIRFYLDENLSPEIIIQLRSFGIDAIRGPLEDSDQNHLQRAGALGRVLCTQDEDLVRLHNAGVDHAGIIKGHNARHSIGAWVRFLTFIHSVCTKDDLTNCIEYVFHVD